MTEAVRCGRCGIKYDARHERCPKCGGRVPRPIGLRADAVPLGSEGDEGRGPGLPLGVALLTVAMFGAVLWTASSFDAPPATAVAVSAASPLMRVFQREPPRPVRGTRIPTDVAFIDSPAAGRREYTAGHFDTALAHFRDQLERNPRDAEAHSNAGQLLVRLGRTSEALPLLREATELDPGRWAYRFNLARAEGLLGLWDVAVEDYGRAAALFPGDYATLFNLAQALHRAGREAEAVAQYKLAIQQKPDDSSFYLALGISEEKLGHAAEAGAAYRRFVEMDPSARQAEAVKARAGQLEAKAKGVPASPVPPAAVGAHAGTM